MTQEEKILVETMYTLLVQTISDLSHRMYTPEITSETASTEYLEVRAKVMLGLQDLRLSVDKLR